MSSWLPSRRARVSASPKAARSGTSSRSPAAGTGLDLRRRLEIGGPDREREMKWYSPVEQAQSSDGTAVKSSVPHRTGSGSSTGAGFESLRGPRRLGRFGFTRSIWLRRLQPTDQDPRWLNRGSCSVGSTRGAHPVRSPRAGQSPSPRPVPAEPAAAPSSLATAPGALEFSILRTTPEGYSTFLIRLKNRQSRNRDAAPCAVPGKFCAAVRRGRSRICEHSVGGLLARPLHSRSGP